MTATTRDASADTARRLYALYLKASRLSDRERARIRMRAIVLAAQDAGVWKAFVALRGGGA